jgi:hypothetical protein
MSRLPAFPELREVNRDRIAFDHRAADRGEIRCRVKSGVRSSFRVIRCRVIFPGKNDELTPDFSGKNDELTPDFFDEVAGTSFH